MNILLWIVLGALAGWIASQIMKTEQGLIVDILVGIVGAFVGGFLFNQFGASGVTGFNLPSILVAIVGSVVLLAVVKMVRRA